MEDTWKDEIQTSDVENNVKPGEWNPTEKWENSIGLEKASRCDEPQERKEENLANQRRNSGE
jgi:hypothetical protein